MVKNAPPKAIQLWMKSVKTAQSETTKAKPIYGFVSGGVLKRSLQIYCAKTSYGS
jgi:hypothetical protein